MNRHVFFSGLIALAFLVSLLATSAGASTPGEWSAPHYVFHKEYAGGTYWAYGYLTTDITEVGMFEVAPFIYDQITVGHIIVLWRDYPTSYTWTFVEDQGTPENQYGRSAFYWTKTRLVAPEGFFVYAWRWPDFDKYFEFRTSIEVFVTASANRRCVFTREWDNDQLWDGVYCWDGFPMYAPLLMMGEREPPPVK